MPVVRRIKPDELRKTFEIIALEPFGLQWEKYSLLYNGRPDQFYLIETDDGDIGGAVSFFETLPKVFQLGYLVVKKEYRKFGYGKKMVCEAMDMFDHKAIVVTGAPGTGGFYRKVGQTRTDSLPSHMFEMMTFEPERLAQKVAAGTQGMASTVAIEAYDEARDLQDLLAYDNDCRGHDSSGYMRVLFQFADVLVARYTDGGHIAGYSANCVTKAQDGKTYLSTEGLYADSDGVALLLFRDTLNKYPDVPKVKMHFVDGRHLLRDLGETHLTLVGYRFTQGDPVDPVVLHKTYLSTDCDFTH